MNKELELLAPAGSPDIVKAVIRAGADAVYLGGNMFGARAYANNLGEEELLEAIDYAHIHERKIFLTVNTLLKNNEIEGKLYDYLLPAYEAGLDAVIVQDFGVVSFVREFFPQLSIHASTQMTVAGVDGARMLKEAGVDRVVTARELSLDEIREIHENVDVEIESFVHGALCYCYSGQCLFSSMLGGRSGNRGRCAQPCRLPYTVLDEKGRSLNPGKPYVLSLKDLNTIELLPQIAESGVYSFKIEGRMKSVEYAAGVVSVYRNYMDRYLAGGKKDEKVLAGDLQKLFYFGNRNGFTKGYYQQWNGKEMLTGDSSTHSKTGEIARHVLEYTEKEIKEKIKGKLTLFKGSHAMMQVTDGENTVEVTGEIVQKALKNPLGRENVLEKVRQTGNTPFVFEELDLQMEEDIFLPVSALKNIRQEALMVLEKRRLDPYRRYGSAVYPSKKKTEDSLQIPEAGNKELVVSTESRAAIEAACNNAYVSTIYLDSLLYQKANFLDMLRRDVDTCKKYGKRVFYILPAIFRQQTREFYGRVLPEINKMAVDGFLVKSYDELGFLKAMGIQDKEIRLDHNMYTYSNWAALAFYQYGVGRDTIPLELNRKEIRHRDNQKSELLIYGYLPLMISAGCVHKNVVSPPHMRSAESTKKCDRQQKLLYLKDRYEVRFPVMNCCSECYNILYNAKPLFLLPLAKELDTLELKAFRIHFTWESEAQIASVFDAYESAFIRHDPIRKEELPADYTNGHYKRGVE